MTNQFALKRPCKNCPFQPTLHAITFRGEERAEEIAEQAYRYGFPCHLSAIDTSEDEDGNENENGGYEFGPNTQHCAGAIMLFLSDGSECGWPGIGNDEELAEKLNAQMDWNAPHYEREDDFIKGIGKRP